MRSVLFILAISACRSAMPGMAGAAALNTAVAGTTSAVSRAQGGCFANCPPGTACNRQTGFCDELPCRGRCAPDEECDSRGLFPKCVRARPADLSIGAKPTTRAEPDAEHPL